MASMQAVHRFSALISFFCFSTAIFTQTQTDFYDPYDFSMKNMKDKEIAGETFKEYTLPPKHVKPPLVTPRNPAPPLTPPIQNITSGLKNNLNTKEPAQIINPYNATVDFDAFQRAAKEKEKKKEELALKRQRMKAEIYKESPARRFVIIFLITLPFAALIGYGAAAGASIQKTPEGAALTGVTAIGLSGWNAWHDKKYMEQYKSNGSAAGNDHLQIYFTLAEKNF